MFEFNTYYGRKNNLYTHLTQTQSYKEGQELKQSYVGAIFSAVFCCVTFVAWISNVNFALVLEMRS